MTIDSRLIDVDLPLWRPGEPCGGAIFDPAEDAHYGAEFPAALIIPEDEWKDRCEAQQFDLRKYNLKINDQNPESSCVFNGTETAMRIKWTEQLGVLWSIDLSPMSGYGPNASSRHSGYNVWQALEDVRVQGLLPEDTPRNRRIFGDHVMHQNTPFSRRLPAGCEETKKIFRPVEWISVSNKLEFGSALLKKIPLVYGRRGHCICAVCMQWDSRNNRPLACFAQSYGTWTGANGYQYDSMDNWATGGTWGLTGMTLPNDELINRITQTA